MTDFDWIIKANLTVLNQVYPVELEEILDPRWDVEIYKIIIYDQEGKEVLATKLCFFTGMTLAAIKEKRYEHIETQILNTIKDHVLQTIKLEGKER